MLKRIVIVLLAFVLFILLIIPARAESGWILWDGTDCTDWSGGCEDGLILVDGTTYTTFDSIYCSRAMVHVCYYSNTDVQVNTYIGAHTLTGSGGEYVCADLEFSPLNTSYVSVAGEGYVTGIVAECFDPRPASFYGTPPTPQPASLDAMTEAGEDVLADSTATVLPMIIGLTVGMGVVVAILRFMRWL